MFAYGYALAHAQCTPLVHLYCNPSSALRAIRGGLACSPPHGGETLSGTVTIATVRPHT